MRSGKKVPQLKNHLDDLPKEIKLHIFSFLKSPEIINLSAVNKANQVLFDNNFWHDRISRDYKLFSKLTYNPKKKFVALDRYQITKIFCTDFGVFGIDHLNSLHILQNSYDRNYVNQIIAIAKFAEKHKVLDMQMSAGGAIYLLTKDGLFDFGTNYESELGLDTNHNASDKIFCVYQNKSSDQIIDFVIGMDYLMIQTANKLYTEGYMNAYIPPEMKSPADLIKMKSGSYKIALQLMDNSFVLIGRDFNGLFKNCKTIQYDSCKHSTYLLNDFCQKKVINYFLEGEQMLVWCDDGIYVAGDGSGGQLGAEASAADKFIKLAFFNSKNIINIYLSSKVLLVHCDDGLYVTGLDNQNNNNSFTKLSIDPTPVTNVKLNDHAIFIEQYGNWYKLSETQNAITLEQSYLESVAFIPLKQIAKEMTFNKSKCCIL